MDVEINSVYLTRQSIIIECTDVGEMQYIRQSRERDDEERTLSFEFPQDDPKAINYLRNWLKRQKRVKELMQKEISLSWGLVLQAVVGTDTQISGKWLIPMYD